MTAPISIKPTVTNDGKQSKIAAKKIKKNLDGSTTPLTPLNKKLEWLLGSHYGDLPLWKRINYFQAILLTLIPIIGVYGLATTTSPIRLPTVLFAVIYFALTELGITAGYHRLFSHRAYEAGVLVKVLMLALGAGAFEGSAKWWARGHRTHHRHVDTPKDPYSAKNGFWFAHIGWMIVKTDFKKIGKAEIDDLKADKLVALQHKYYVPIALFMAFLFPAIVAHFGWNDFRGGLYIVGFLRLFFVHHSTFCVNSLAHFAGKSVYSDRHTAKNSIITALITMGEGYHNFHHEFPSDYRNGVRWYQYDPTKVFIRVCSLLGLTYNLKRFPDNEIQKGMLQMQRKAIDKKMEKLNWGPDVDALPVYTMEQVKSEAKSGKTWMVIDGFVIDYSSFTDTHPGGEKILRVFKGKDATKAFYGGVYKHSQAGRNLQATLRVGRVEKGC